MKSELNTFQNPAIIDVQRILTENNLPTDDLHQVNLEHFFCCGTKEHPKGIGGLEVHGSDGLLRSLAVSSKMQGLGCGRKLLTVLEAHARSVGVEQLYLLTETAEAYFKLHGFSTITRAMAPSVIKNTREFSEICPDSAVLMLKAI